MAITRPPKNIAPTTAAEAFVAGAIEKPAKTVRAKKTAISLTLAPALLDDIDALATAMGTSRAGAISMAIHRSVVQAKQDGLM
jgi:hypothetical protein